MHEGKPHAQPAKTPSKDPVDRAMEKSGAQYLRDFTGGSPAWNAFDSVTKGEGYTPSALGPGMFPLGKTEKKNQGIAQTLRDLEEGLTT